jgi:hypothetical protein
MRLPQEATITWALFTPKMDRVRAASTDEAGPLPYYLTPDDTVLRWKNFLKRPTMPTVAVVEPPPAAFLPWMKYVGWGFVAGSLSLLIACGVLVGRGKPRGRRRVAIAVSVLALGLGALVMGRRSEITDEQAKSVTGSLLRNVYVAFDFRAEEQVYDTLNQSVAGDLLTNTYLETKKSLELASQGGARVKVKAVEILEVVHEPVEDGQGFAARCRWNVSGAVGHWGHIHQRTNQYEARITVRPVDGAWKITDLELLQEERIS